MYLYLLRHGVTEWNSQYKIQGASDIPLNQKGEEMAGQTGKTLKNKGVIFDAVYSSPLVRAMRSAVLVSDSKEIHPDERLREMGFGRQEGETVLRMAESDMPFRYFKENPVLYDTLVSAGDPSAETFTELTARAESFLKETIEGREAGLEQKEGKERTILISGHGALDQALIVLMKGITDYRDFWKGGLLPNCGMDLIRFDSVRGSYTFLEEMKIFYDRELFEKSPKLMK